VDSGDLRSFDCKDWILQHAELLLAFATARHFSWIVMSHEIDVIYGYNMARTRFIKITRKVMSCD